MVSVAQKTLLIIFLAFSFSILAKVDNAKAKATDFYKSENLLYKVSLNGIRIGDAVISYAPNKKDNTYKFFAKAETKGFMRNLYKINDTIIVYGNITNQNLKPRTHSIILKESSYRASRTANTDYEFDLLTVKNNKKNTSETFVLLDKAKDILSTLYTLRFNTDLNSLKDSNVLKKTIQFAHKTVKNDIKITGEYNFSLNDKQTIKARNVLIKSKKVRLLPLNELKIKEIKNNDKKSADFLEESINNKKTYEYEQNIKVVISSDDKKIPLIIEYVTKYGKFRAVLKDYSK